MGVAYLYATTLMFKTAFDYEPTAGYIFDSLDLHAATTPVVRRSSRAHRRRLEGIGESIGTEIVRMVTDHEGRRYPVDMWFEASEIVTPSLVRIALTSPSIAH